MDNNIICNTSRAIPETNTYMMEHIGGTGSLDNIDGISEDIDLDTDISYTKDQKTLIDASKKTIYQKTQHNEIFDIPESGFNIVQNHHPYILSFGARLDDFLTILIIFFDPIAISC